MVKIGVTGIHGLIGWHLHAFLHSVTSCQVIGADRATFSSRGSLQEFVTGLDVLVHFAGMNRGDDVEIETTNIGLTQALIRACENSGNRPHIIFASSTHADRNTPYARSKRESARLCKEWATRNASVFTNLVLPHVFGEGGKPFYNSVVSTFCHQLANRQTPEIINDGELELVHAQEVAKNILTVVQKSSAGDIRVPGVAMRVSELLDKLKTFDDLYRDQIIPNVLDSIDLYLFNTYRSYLFPSYYPLSLKLHQDSRGSLFEAVKSLGGGQSFISVTRPGVTRGLHYHGRKIERFLVLSGTGLVRVRKLFSDTITEFTVTGDDPQYIDMPTLHTHSITNIGDFDMTTLFWSNEIFDPENPDTFSAPVQVPS